MSEHPKLPDIVELEPCPFCGGEAGALLETRTGEWKVWCLRPTQKCGCMMIGDTRGEVERKWNCRAEIERLRSPVPAEQWSPGVAKAMEVFEKGLAKRRIDELGLPWHVEPWGDGSKPPYVNICSNSHGAVIAADLDRDTANWICNMANLSVEKVE